MTKAGPPIAVEQRVAAVLVASLSLPARCTLCAATQGFIGMPDPQHLLQPMNGGMPEVAPGTSEPLQLTQLLGSEAEQQVLLTQPKVHIIARAKMQRGDRLVSRAWCTPSL